MDTEGTETVTLWTPSGNRSRWAEFLNLTKWWYLCFGSAVLIICRTAELRTSSPWVVISDSTYWNSSRSYEFKLWADVTVKGVISPGTTRKTKSLLSHVREPAGSEKKDTRSQKLDWLPSVKSLQTSSKTHILDTSDPLHVLASSQLIVTDSLRESLHPLQ